MRIRRLRVEGFGSLKGDFIFSSDRCNLVLEPNESGKSTLAAAIVAALYGMPRQRSTRERPVTMKERYRPWGGGPFGVEIEVDCADKAYIARRDFEQETTTVFDGRTGKEITAEFSTGRDQVDFGEAVTGLTRDDFTRCCFVGQREIETLREAGGLTHALQRIASSQHGDVAAGEALEALTRAAEQDYKGMRLGKGKVETEIRRLEKEIDEVRAEMEQISARRRESEEKILRLEEATVREGRAESDLTRVDYLQLVAAREEVRSSLQQCAREEEEFQRYRSEMAQLEAYAVFPAEKLGRLRELKGKIDSLRDRKALAERRLLKEVEEPLRRAEEAIAPLAQLGVLGPAESRLVSDRLAVLQDCWKLRREKRLALRREERRLAAAGVAPARVTQIAEAFAPLSEEDRRFLGDYRERMLEVKAALTAAERERDRLIQVEGGESISLVSLAAARRAEGIALLVGFLGIVLTPVLWFTLENKTPLLLTVLLAGAGFLWWLRLQERKPVLGAEEFGSGLQRAQTEVWGKEKELAALQESLSRVAGRLSHPKPDRMVEEFRELEDLQEKAAPLAALVASGREIMQRYDAAAKELIEYMQRAGRAPASRLVTPRLARRFRDQLAGYLEAAEQVRSMRLDLEAGLKDLAAAGVEIESLRREMESVIAAALPAAQAPADLEAALAMFEEAAARRERHDRLAREILPAAERRNAVPPAERTALLNKDLEVLSRQIDRAVAQNPALAAFLPQRSSREYAEERRRLQEEVRATQRERIALSEELGDILKEYRRDFPGRQAMLASLESALARAVAFRDAVGIATQVLSTISREAYAEWAEVLNEKTSDILRRLNPNYEDVRFDTDLTFTLRDGRTGQRRDQTAVDANFSAGARDQVYLAIRVAVSEYISAGGLRLPFVLDDPFASFDDDRFSRAMEFLLERIGRRHQVILLSCQTARHRRWQEEASDLMTDRVRILDLTPLSS